MPNLDPFQPGSTARRDQLAAERDGIVAAAQRLVLQIEQQQRDLESLRSRHAVVVAILAEMDTTP